MRARGAGRPPTCPATAADERSPAAAAGLSRRKDLTLRQDVRLTVGGQQRTLADLFKVGATCFEAALLCIRECHCTRRKRLQSNFLNAASNGSFPVNELHQPLRPSPAALPCFPRSPAQGQRAVVFGVPDCGKVCSEQHVPSFLQRGDELRRLGVNKILCVAVGDAAAADAWAQKVGIADGSKIQVGVGCGLCKVAQGMNWLVYMQWPRAKPQSSTRPAATVRCCR